MPEKSQTIAVTGRSASDLQSIAYGTFQQLDWRVKYAGDNVLLGYTQKSLARYDNEITVKTAGNEITVTSKMIHGEAFDLMGRTKKDINKFLEAFEIVKAGTNSENSNEWSEKISLLKQETIVAANEETKQAQEIDKVMNLSKGSRTITYGIIAANVLVFVLMVASGVSVLSPSGADIIRWGANFGPLTLSGDWWRLITCVFVHIGIIHILFNMYALYMVGVYLEPMLGKVKYLTAYLCTGIFASLASLWWHKEPIASAGASGAIFGMYGVFLALLTTNLIPKQVRNSLLQSIGIFVVYNLAYGMKSGVDNSAHIGGLLSGLLIGFIYYLGLRPGSSKKTIMAGAIGILTLAAAAIYIQGNTVTAEKRSAVNEELNDLKYSDAMKYEQQMQKFADAEEKALAPLKEDHPDLSRLAEQLQNISMPEWEKADRAVKEMKTYKVSEKSLRKADLLEQYIALRKQDLTIRIISLKQNDDSVNGELESINSKIDSLFGELKALQ